MPGASPKQLGLEGIFHSPQGPLTCTDAGGHAMHGYSTDSSERRVVPFLLASLAIILAWMSSRLFAVLILHLSVPWWVDAPSSMAFYGILYTLFDRHFWRNSLVYRLGLVRVPNLAGRWHGYLITSFDGYKKHHNLMITVFQTWTQITVYFTTATSISCSCAAMLQVEDQEGVALVYQYQCQPLVDANGTMHMHYGTAMLRLSNGECLNGDYYTGRDRRTCGRICTKRL